MRKSSVIAVVMMALAAAVRCASAPAPADDGYEYMRLPEGPCDNCVVYTTITEGRYSGARLALGRDGLPFAVVVTFDSRMYAVHCRDNQCRNSTTRLLPGTVRRASFSLVAGGAIAPVIAFAREGDEALVVLRCGDDRCNSATAVPADVPDRRHWALAVQGDRPVIVPADEPLGVTVDDNGLWVAGVAAHRNVTVAHCVSGCSVPRTVYTAPPDRKITHVRIASDGGNPLIAMLEQPEDVELPNRLYLVRCRDMQCRTSDKRLVAEKVAPWGIAPFNAEGRPVLFFVQAKTQTTHRAACRDEVCTSLSVTPVPDRSGGDIVVPADGRAIFAFPAQDGKQLAIARCVDSACSDVTTHNIPLR